MSANDKTMSFTDHLAELRRRLTVCALVYLGAAIGSFGFADRIARFLIAPAGGIRFVYLSPPALFMAYVKIALVAGLVLALPVILAELFLFVVPALERGGRLKVALAFLSGALFFAGGAVFSFLVVVPFTLRFFLSYANPAIEAMYSITDYYDFVSSMALAFGLTFEFPMLAWVLGSFGLVKAALLVQFRKYSLLGIFIVAAIITPPDVVSQVALALPMLGLYELSIIILSAQERGRRRRELRMAKEASAS